MVRRLLLFTLLFVMILLAGCGGASERTLNFRSIACTESGEIMSLGDTRTVFDKALGEGEYMGHGSYSYLDGALEVGFENNRATGLQFNTYPPTDRITFYNLDLDMTLQELRDNFTQSEVAKDGDGVYNRFFDSAGNEVPQEKSDYTLTVAYFHPIGVVYVVLRQNK